MPAVVRELVHAPAQLLHGAVQRAGDLAQLVLAVAVPERVRSPVAYRRATSAIDDTRAAIGAVTAQDSRRRNRQRRQHAGEAEEQNIAPLLGDPGQGQRQPHVGRPRGCVIGMAA